MTFRSMFRANLSESKLRAMYLGSVERYERLVKAYGNANVSTILADSEVKAAKEAQSLLYAEMRARDLIERPFYE